MENYDHMIERSRRHKKDVSVMSWVGTLLLQLIPIVNLVLLAVWAFGENTNRSKANWAKATLLLYTFGVAFFFATCILSMRYR